MKKQTIFPDYDLDKPFPDSKDRIEHLEKEVFSTAKEIFQLYIKLSRKEQLKFNELLNNY